VQFASDLHLDTRDDAADVLTSLVGHGADVLVLAGDLGEGSAAGDALKWACDRFPEVVYVLGNHEHWRRRPADVLDGLARLDASLPNLYWLHRRTVDLAGLRFAGSTLWFADSPVARDARRWLRDFRRIRDFEPWVYEENAADQAFLCSVQADVVVTHHLPSHRSVDPRFVDSPLNAFFVCDVERSMLRERGAPQLWVHGHTHAPMDYELGGTRVVCNPLGYPGEDGVGFQASRAVRLSSSRVITR
jgi:predicted phosphodiesterase